MSLLLAMGVLEGCATSYRELTGTCVVQEWKFGTIIMRQRDICELPPPEPGDVQVRDRESMEVNPFPDLFERNKADTTDRNLLEKARLRFMYEQSKDPEIKKAIIEEYDRLTEEEK